MKWFEFTQDNSDGSFSKCRFKTKEEAEKTMEWLKETADSRIRHTEGVDEVNTDTDSFWDTFEGIRD